MYPVTSYRVSPGLFGGERWQAEIDGQHSRFARRARTQERAERKIIRDEEHLYEPGGVTFMQGVVLPATMPLRRWYDKLCRAAETRRRKGRA